MRNLLYALSLAAVLTIGSAGRMATAQTFVIREATVHPVSGPVIESGTVVVQNGIITHVGPDDSVPVPAGARVIQAAGKIVTPGFIDMATAVGLSEVGNVANTRDNAGSGPPIRAAFDVQDGINPASIVIPSVRLGGVTTVAAIPSGGLIAGQGSVIDLFGETLSDVLVSGTATMHGQFNESAASAAGGSRGAAALMLRAAFEDTRYWSVNQDAFLSGENRPIGITPGDARALNQVLTASIPLVMTASRASDIDAVLRMSDEFGFDPVISGGEEAWRRAGVLAERNVPVLVKPLANSPVQFDRLGTRFDNAALLADAGVDVVISSFETHKAASLRREAGHAVRYGMDWDAALEAVTLAPARALQIDISRGSIEAGKVANLVVWSGDPFQFSSRAEHVFIRGHEMVHDSRQKRLLRRYRTLDGTPPQYKSNR